jgi:hypothetical protein
MAAALVIKVTVVMAAATGLQWTLGRRASAAARHLGWTGTIVILLLLPAITLVLPHWTLEVPGPDAVAPAGRQVVMTASATDHQGPSRLALVDQPGPAEPFAQEHEPLRSAFPWRLAFLGGYLAGLFFLLGRLMLQAMIARRIVRQSTEITDREWIGLLRGCCEHMAITLPIRLLRSSGISMPMAARTPDAAILIPSTGDEWTPDRRRAVLLHELAHIARRDCETQALASVACALYWPHAGVWWAARQVRIERELACDDRVLAAGTDARDYAEHLLEIAYAMKPRRQPALAVAMASRGQLEGRMLAVLDAARNRTAPAVRSSVTAATLTAALVLPLATLDARVVPGLPEPAAGALSAAATSAAAAIAAEPAAAIGEAVAQAAARTPDTPAMSDTGTWILRPEDRGRVQLTFGDRRHSIHSTSIALQAFVGFPAPALTGAGGPVQFVLRRDAGSFAFEGVVRSSVGGGTVTFTPDAAFATALTRRGLARPTDSNLRTLALADVGNAFFAELRDDGYAMPDLPLLIRAAEHGVDRGYIHDLAQAGYKLGTLAPLITLRDHGVDGDYVRALAAYNLRGLAPADLQRARDHGVDAEDLRELTALGYRNLPVDELIRIRDHGVDTQYVRDLAALGFRNLALDELVATRNHGVDTAYVRDMQSLGYRTLSLPDLVRLRSHGVDATYVRDLATVGLKSLPVDSLLRLRDHGVSADYVRAFREMGYSGIDVTDFTALRDAGISPDEARAANTRAGTRLSVGSLRQLAATGWRVGWLTEPDTATPMDAPQWSLQHTSLADSGIRCA